MTVEVHMFIFKKDWSCLNTISEAAITQSLLKATLLTLVNMAMEILSEDLFAAIRTCISLPVVKNIENFDLFLDKLFCCFYQKPIHSMSRPLKENYLNLCKSLLKYHYHMNIQFLIH